MNPRMGAILLLAGSGLVAQSEPALLFSECSDTSAVKRIVQASDLVVVRHSVAGGPQTCYAVSVSGESGRVLEGFLIGLNHPAVRAFDHKEEEYIAQVFTGAAETKKQSQPKPMARAKRYKFWNPFSSR
jgi:hypothetical protein